MSRRALPPLVLRDFQREAVDNLVFALTDTAGKIRSAPTRRHEIMRQIGCLLLEAPTASGKTVMLAAAAERTSVEQPVVWFWSAPFKGVVEQTAAALLRAAPGMRGLIHVWIALPSAHALAMCLSRPGRPSLPAMPKADGCGWTMTCSRHSIPWSMRYATAAC